MKKVFCLMMTFILSFMFLSGCASDFQGGGKSMNINPEGIQQITVSTQATEPKQDIVVEGERVGELINRLNSYSLSEMEDGKEKGWQYLIKIEKNDGKITLISFMDKKVKVDDNVFEVRDYSIDDFMYLFM